MKWDKKSQSLYGTADIELLDKLTSIARLPSTVEQRWRELHALQEAVDRERTRPAEGLKPMVKYPVKPNLYAHQTRAANMALMVFGMVEPPRQGVGN